MNGIITGGNLAEKLLRNRGRTRALVAGWNLRILQRRLELFRGGAWQPVPPKAEADYAISLTSWAKRIDDLQITLLTLISQDVQPAGIYVWLTPEDRTLFPADLAQAFEKCGVIFRECPDYRSHKKWLPMTLSGPERPFVICDDDIFYPPKWFGKLVAEDRPDAYVGCKCHRMSAGYNGFPGPYSEWDKQIYHQKVASELFLTTGCGGAIIHPSRLNGRALDWGAIQEHSLFSDDVWIKGAHRARGIPVFKTRYCFPCLELPGTDESGLLKNYNSDQNDEQIKAVWGYFGLKIGS